MMSRIAALWRKETLEISRNPGVLVPVVMVGLLSLALPFSVAILIPQATGHPLGEDSDLLRVSAITFSALEGDSRVQLFLFQQFLILFLLIPITGAMSLAAHSIIGEKQARTLEPLLATPISTGELLIAKLLAALAPSLTIAFLLLALYFTGIAALADPGVLPELLNARTAVLVALVCPASALVALQMAVVVSSRVNDPRTAQQFGVFLILPVSTLLVAQFVGFAWISAEGMALAAAVLLAIWLALLAVSVRLFDRETILTRWR
jgi:ABC-2 type transport system permease protein